MRANRAKDFEASGRTYFRMGIEMKEVYRVNLYLYQACKQSSTRNGSSNCEQAKRMRLHSVIGCAGNQSLRSF